MKGRDFGSAPHFFWGTLLNYYDLTQKFIEDCKTVTSLRQLAELFNTLSKKIGCTHFVCMSHVNALNPPDDAIVLSNYPIEWAMYHSSQHYHTIDPVLHTCKTQLTPFKWSDEHWRHFLNPKQEYILAEASEFDLIEGYTIPIHPPSGYPASLSVAFEPGTVDQEALNALHLVAFFLYETALRMKTTKVSVHEHKDLLTERQRRILELIAQGKSNWDISVILSVSENTVKDHISNIFKNLNVRTRQQAIVRGLFCGEIRYLDLDVSPPVNSNEKSGLVILRD